MEKEKPEYNFWPSITDLMVSMFIIVLVLFVVSYSMYRSNEITVKTVDDISNLDSKIDPNYFRYDAFYKRFELTRSIQFDNNDSRIREKDKEFLRRAGISLQNLLNKLKTEKKKNGEDQDLAIRYIILIEGMSSVTDADSNYNADLSYRRSRDLYQFWRYNGIAFDTSYCEVQISGSGFEGLGRYPKIRSNSTDNFQGYTDYDNQRILIQVIPKIGRLKESAVLKDE